MVFMMLTSLKPLLHETYGARPEGVNWPIAGLSLGNQQQTIHQGHPHPYGRAGMQIVHLIASANFCALNSLSTERLTP
eukprot:470360-Pelagomonas_calceolata.AAC.3